MPGIIFSRHERPTRHPDTYAAASSYSPSTPLRQFQIPTPQYVYPKNRHSRDEREAGCHCRHRRVCRRRKAESSSCPSSRVSSYGCCCDECRADHDVSLQSGHCKASNVHSRHDCWPSRHLLYFHYEIVYRYVTSSETALPELSANWPRKRNSSRCTCGGRCQRRTHHIRNCRHE